MSWSCDFYCVVSVEKTFTLFCVESASRRCIAQRAPLNKQMRILQSVSGLEYWTRVEPITLSTWHHTSLAPMMWSDIGQKTVLWMSRSSLNRLHDFSIAAVLMMTSAWANRPLVEYQIVSRNIATSRSPSTCKDMRSDRQLIMCLWSNNAPSWGSSGI